MIIDELVARLGFDLKGEGELRKFNQGLDGAERSARSFSTTLVALGGAAVAALGGLAIGRQVGDFISNITGTNAQFEDYAASLKTVTGSSNSAKAALDWITDFAQTTPYDVAGVTESFIRLKAYGLDPMDGTLRTVGDAASAMGKGLMDGVEAIADAITGENERLKSFGITTSVAGDRITYKWSKDGKEMTRTVNKNAKDIHAALIDIMGRFDGAMDERARTWNGMTSNMAENWTKFLRKIGAAGYYDHIKGRLQGLLDFAERGWTNGTFDAIAGGISQGLIAALNTTTHLATQAWRVGAAFFHAGAGVVDLTSRITGLSKGMSAAGLGVGLLASSTMGRGVLMAIARRVPFVAAALAIDEVIAGLNGDKSLIGATEEGQQALDRLKDKFAKLDAAAKAFADSLGVLREKIVTSFDLPPEALSNLDDLKTRWDALKEEFGGTWKIGELEINADPAFDSVETWAKDATTRFKTFFSDPMQGAMLLLIDGINRIATGLEALANALNILAAPMESVQGALDWIDDKTGNTTQRQSGRRQELLRPSPKGGVAGDKMGRLGSSPDDRVSSAFDVSGGGGTSGFNAAQVAQGLENLRAHIQAMGAKEVNQSIQSTIAPQDNRQFPVTVNSTVNQTVQQASQAPAAAARATSAAIGQAAVQSRPQVAQSAAP